MITTISSLFTVSEYVQCLFLWFLILMDFLTLHCPFSSLLPLLLLSHARTHSFHHLTSKGSIPYYM